MKLTFISNYFNHHQRPLCEAFAHMPEVDFTFYQTEPMEEERVRMGWALDVTAYPYVRIWQEDPEAAKQRVLQSDVVIWGGVEARGPEAVLEERLQAGKLTFRYSERIYKEGQWKFISPRGLKQKYHDFTQYRKAPYFLLCAGAFVGSDFKLVHAFPKKKFVWGYFPEVKHYDMDELFAKKSKEGEPVRILWAGRMIDWKHPELAIETAEALLHGNAHLAPELSAKIRENGGFILTMAGGGEMEEKLRRQAAEKGLQDVVRFTGFLKPEEIRAEMERSDIFLFTSDEKEGWGAVLNEAMNSGCVVIARPEIGAVPYLVQQNINGKVAGNRIEYLAGCTGWEILHREERRELGERAYQTMVRYWNAENAAAQFLRVAKGLLAGEAAVFAEEDAENGALQPMCRDREIGPNDGARFARRW
ncbi:MAG: glycosyltransferase family 4 protein [Lachnospiraceae bacterium]|nr:glycosyltransferase family 4 protein [Lachnospiraceae bacterium]MBR6156411.1 glycosyltransferase family 4 protein [Lachnospiraceae bacterium]